MYFNFYSLLQIQIAVVNGHFAGSSERPHYNRVLQINFVNEEREQENGLTMCEIAVTEAKVRRLGTNHVSLLSSKAAIFKEVHSARRMEESPQCASCSFTFRHSP